MLIARVARDQIDGVAVVEHGRADLAGADFGAAQILQQCHGLAERQALGADHLHHVSVIGVRAVREVEPRDVHAGLDQAANGVAAVDGGSEGTNDFCAASDH